MNTTADSQFLERAARVAADTIAALRTAPRVALVIAIATLAAAVVATPLVGDVLPDTSTLDLERQFAAPWPLENSSLDHPLGTDRLGRDTLSRMLIGAQVSMSIAAIAILFSGLLGTAIGLFAGYAGGWWDATAMRGSDILLSFPSILVAVVFSVTVGPSYWVVITVVSVYLLPQFVRLVRADVLSLKERDFVLIARVISTSRVSIVIRHLLPNVLDRVVVLASLQVGWVIVAEAGLSFLGAGVPPPTPTWGNMLADGRRVMETAWWLTVFPGLAITMVVLSFNLLGDWLRDTLDPRLQQRIT